MIHLNIVAFSGQNFLVVPIATARYCSRVERIPEQVHIPVVIFFSCRVDSPMFTRSSVFSRKELRWSSGCHNSEQRGVLTTGFCQKHISIICLCWFWSTPSTSRWEQSISGFDYIKIFCGAILILLRTCMKMKFCIGSFNSPFASFVHWQLLFRRHIEAIVLTRENRKREWNNCSLKKRRKEMFCIDEIQRRLLSVPIEG